MSQYAYCVPYLQLDVLLFEGYGARAEFNSYCEIVGGLEAFVGELEQKTGLADA